MPNFMLIIGIGIIFIILTAVSTLLISKSRENDAVIKSDEVAATAKVLEIIDTGDRYNKNPVVKLKLEVNPGNALPFAAEVRTVISVVDVPAFQPGSVIRVKFKQNNSSVVTVIGR
jgi:hypothetical protein